MNIEPCTITTTETRTREMWCPDLNHAAVVCTREREFDYYSPVTLTYPASVQVPGVRVEMDKHQWREVIEALANAKGLPWEFACKMDELLGSGRFVQPEWRPEPQPDSQPQPVIDMQAAVKNACEGLTMQAKVGPPFNEPASDGSVYGNQQPQPARVPYTLWSWPYGCPIMRDRESGDEWPMTRAEKDGVCIGSAVIPWATLAARYDLSTDGGKTWYPCYQTETKPAADTAEWVPVGVRVPNGLNSCRDVVARTSDGQEGKAWWDDDDDLWRLYVSADECAAKSINKLNLTVTAWREIREGETVGYFAAKGGAA